MRIEVGMAVPGLVHTDPPDTSGPGGIVIGRPCEPRNGSARDVDTRRPALVSILVICERAPVRERHTARFRHGHRICSLVPEGVNKPKRHLEALRALCGSPLASAGPRLRLSACSFRD